VAALALAMMPGRTAPPVVLVGGSVAPILLLAHHPHGLAVAESLALSRMLGLTWEAVVGPALLLVVVVVLTGWDHRRVKAVVLDPAWAASQGIPVTAIQVGVGAIAGLAVAVCLPVVGVIGISGFLLLPPLAATSLAPALGTRLWVAPVVATGAVLGALPVSHGMDWPPIPTTMGILVLLVLLVPWVTRGFRSERHR
jgi:ABC-type Mn2+/Zn2+ transport system permease subunit